MGRFRMLKSRYRSYSREQAHQARQHQPVSLPAAALPRLCFGVLEPAAVQQPAAFELCPRRGDLSAGQRRIAYDTQGQYQSLQGAALEPLSPAAWSATLQYSRTVSAILGADGVRCAACSAPALQGSRCSEAGRHAAAAGVFAPFALLLP
jgi:hypothetical protein